MIKIAINGFGRIGRTTLRRLIDAYPGKLQLVAVNDLTDKANIVYLLKYDTVYKTFNGFLKETEKGFLVGRTEKDAQEVIVTAERDPRNLKWGELGVDIVIEATGFFANKAGAQLHLDAGAKKVIISAPGGNDVKTIVYNVNHTDLTKDDKIISAASCTTNSIAPLVAFMDKEFGIEVGKLTTVHAYTGNQAIVDAPAKKDMRRGRAGAQNIIPSSTGAAKAIGLVVKNVSGFLDGAALRVPVVAGSVSDLTLVLKTKGLTAEKINETMKKYSNESFGYNEDQIVSSDILGSTYGAILDATLTKVNHGRDGHELVTVAAWYDNEMSFVSQLVRLIIHVAELS
ncbi:type I glyceraldehyde-3-phosphate dehydrogenase [Mycoplasmopsis agassizii]|uniref:type I glyceraldehyde-3-phosphate dehydrogenase n=1 Tax=Mycoplasmopsis agassizii TaxID=33922 RepID=UPI0035293D1E